MRHLCVIGDPVDHSLSPVMHNTAIGTLGLEKEYTYAALRISPGELENFIGGMRKGPITGASVTMPHKETIIPYLDDISKTAEASKAVNTVVCDNYKIVGHNTDGEGCLNALREAGAEPEGKRVVLLGAGGAAKAIANALVENQVYTLSIINRTEARAKTLAESLGIKVMMHGGLDLIKEAMGDADIVINTTPVGMTGSAEGQSLIPKELMREDLAVMDIVYNPRETRLLADALAVGAKAIDGRGMLAHQGAIQFKLFTGEDVPIEVMKNTLLECLEDD